MTATFDVLTNVQAYATVLHTTGAARNNVMLQTAGDALLDNRETFMHADTPWNFFQAMIGWLDRNGHRVAAAYLNTGI